MMVDREGLGVGEKKRLGGGLKIDKEEETKNKENESDSLFLPTPTYMFNIMFTLGKKAYNNPCLLTLTKCLITGMLQRVMEK